MKGISFEITLGGAPANGGDHFEVPGDKLLCISMFANLLKNALEASPAGCPIRIQMTRNSGSIVRIENHGETPEAIRPRFFDKYVTSGKEKGTGLGTYSAALIARTQGAKIELDAGTPGMTAIAIQWP